MPNAYAFYILFLLRRFLCALLVFFICFPFVRLLNIEGYNQPYAFFVALMVLPIALLRVYRFFPVWHLITLFYVLTFGLVLFFLTAYPYKEYQEYKYLYSYISFPIITLGMYYFLYKDEVFVLRLLRLAIYLWMLCALIQFFVAPDFATGFIGLSEETAGDISNSGRGVVSLAPEPTHYAFHVLILGAAFVLLGGGGIVPVICVFQALMLAMSSSAILALLIGFCFSILLTFKIKLKYILIGLLLLLLALAILIYGPENRVQALFFEVLSSPTKLLMVDHSVNIRLGGLVASFLHILDTGFLPHGLSHAEWIDSVKIILEDYTWLQGLSLNGPPSGILIILYQGGFLMIVPLICILSVFFRAILVDGYNRPLVLVVPIILFFQYYIASPPFAFVYAIALYCYKERAKNYHLKGCLVQ